MAALRRLSHSRTVSKRSCRCDVSWGYVVLSGSIDKWCVAAGDGTRGTGTALALVSRHCAPVHDRV